MTYRLGKNEKNLCKTLGSPLTLQTSLKKREREVFHMQIYDGTLHLTLVENKLKVHPKSTGIKMNRYLC